MSVQKIIKESMDKNPLNLKEALQEELKTRMSLALEAKMKEMEDEDELHESKDYIDSNASGLESQVSKDLSRHFKMSKSLKHNYNKKLFTLFLTAKGNNERFEVDVMYKEKRGKYMVDRIVIRQGSDVVTDERIDDLTLFDTRDVSDVIQDLIQ